MSKPIHLSGPTCPDATCGKQPLVPIAEMPRPECYWPPQNVGCPACGTGHEVSEAELAAVVRGLAAWDRWVKARDTLAAKRRNGWTPRAPVKRARQMGLMERKP